ncbi:hypothetical protein BD408DRAFT_415119, partial [Parasitella parasitica]
MNNNIETLSAKTLQKFQGFVQRLSLSNRSSNYCLTHSCHFDQSWCPRCSQNIC